MQTAERDRLREIEWLKLEIDEIDRISPKVDEIEKLEQEIKKGAAAEDLSLGAEVVVSALGGEVGALDALSRALSGLQSLVRFDESLQSPFERLQSAEIDLREVFSEMRGYAENIDHDPAGLDKLQQRVEALRSLCRKYGPTLVEVLEHRERAFEKLDRLQNSDKILSELYERQAELLATMRSSADALSRRRRKAAADLGTELVTELSHLAMSKVAFQVEFSVLDDFGPEGCDRAQFLFSPNPGQPPKPLAETASGGELSRVMLALVSILSRFQKQPTLIFDEIDAGLGGRTAEAVAGRLARLARKVQVLCVTHLPVVAAAGDGHLVVEKITSDQSTKVSVFRVDKSRRIEEVARMLSGDASQQRARELATELLETAPK